MQITEVKTFLVDSGGSKNWLFVKVLTDEGVHGWGESYTQADRDGSIIAHIDGMARYLVGRSPFAIKHFAHVMLLDYAVRRPAMEFFSALSGIEQSLIRPMVTGRSPRVIRWPDGITSDPAPTPPADCRNVATTTNRPLSRSSGQNARIIR